MSQASPYKNVFAQNDRRIQMHINCVERLYHGTDQKFSRFDFSKAKPFKDFGRGFYLTTDLSQAQRWAQKKAFYTNQAYIYCYKLEHISEKDWKILELLQYDKRWVDFICACRIEGRDNDYDIIYDRMADSQFVDISEALQDYKNHIITVEKVIERIQWKQTSRNQYCFRNEAVMQLLTMVQMYSLQRTDGGEWEFM